jgi:hypothetical protein
MDAMATAALSACREKQSAAEAVSSDCASRQQQLSVELRLRTEECTRLRRDGDARRTELAQLISSKSRIALCSGDLDVAQRSHDEFMVSYATRSAECKRQIKECGDAMRTLQEEMAVDAQLLQDMSMHRAEIAAMDAAIKHGEQEVAQLGAQVLVLFRENRQLLVGLGLNEDPPSTPQGLAVVVTAVSGAATTHRGRGAALQEQQRLLQREVAGAEALLNSQRSRLTQLASRSAQLSDGRDQLAAMVQQYNNLARHRVLAESQFALLDDRSCSSDQLVSGCQLLENEARELSVICKLGRRYEKTLLQMRTDAGGNCPCCTQAMTAPSINAAFETNLRRIFGPEALATSNAATTTGAGAQLSQVPSIKQHDAVLAECVALSAKAQELQVLLSPLEETRREVEDIERKVVEMTADCEVTKNCCFFFLLWFLAMLSFRGFYVI